METNLVASLTYVICLLAATEAILEVSQNTRATSPKTPPVVPFQPFSASKGTQTCHDYLVSGSGNRVPDSALTASSVFSVSNRVDNYGPSQARLFTKADVLATGTFNRGSWSAGTNNQQQYIQVQLNHPSFVRGVATQGQNVNSSDLCCYNFVKAYKVMYSIDCDNYETVKDRNGNDKVFTGNSDQDTVFTNMLDCPVIARCVRINPLDWNNHVSIRFDLLGCPAQTAEVGKCKNGWEQRPGSDDCYLITDVTDKRTQEDASSECKKQQGHLVKVDSIKERDWLRQKVDYLRQTQGQNHFWVGLSNRPRTDNTGFKWEDQTFLDTSILPWLSGQPDNYGSGEHCVELEFGALNDINCNTHYPYICEIPKYWSQPQNPFSAYVSIPNTRTSPTGTPSISTAPPSPILVVKQNTRATSPTTPPVVPFQPFSAPNGTQTCHDYLVSGRGNRVPDSALTASSVFSVANLVDNYGPSQARLFTKADVLATGTFNSGSWSAGTNNQQQYIQVQLNHPSIVRGVATQGQNVNSSALCCYNFVKAYKVMYSIECVNYDTVKDRNGNDKVFPGNSDQDTVFTNMLDCPVIARCVRINPLDWNNHVSIRFDLLGCPAQTADVGKCKNGWEQRPGSDDCYLISDVTDRRTPDDASAECQKQQGHLVKVDSIQERDWLRQKMDFLRQTQGESHFWVGLSNRPRTDSTGFKWEDQTYLNTSILPWKSGQPDNSGSEHCGDLWNGELNDNKCYEHFPYICEIPKYWSPPQNLPSAYVPIPNTRTSPTGTPSTSTAPPSLQTTANNCSINVDTKHRTWKETQPGAIAVEDCPIGYSGLVSRQCSEEGNWLNPFYNCISKIVAELIAKVEGIKQSPSAEKIGESLEQLVNVTKPANGSSYIGELNAITDMLDTLASISNVNEVTDKQANSFFAATSNLIDTDNTDSWQSDGSNLGNNGSLDGNKASTGSFGAMKVVNVVNKYIEVVLNSLENKHESSKTIQSDNLVVHVEKVNTTAADLKFPEEPLEISSSIILPKSSLNGSKSISAVVYKNLTGLVSSKLKNYRDTTINSEVVTVTVDNWEKNAEFVVDITLEYAQDLRSAPICSFWNETIFAWDTIGCRVLSSNHSSATCRCTHLTNFAILMSPVIQSNVNTKELDIISIVGCSISLAGLMLTAICHVCLWKYISKRRAAVLLNLSVALIISYVMFIGGIDKTENKILCKALASLLHYIYLVVFSLMLVEGIDLAVSVLNVFKNRLKLKWMLTAAWVAPAVIVGITLGVTKTEGYGNEQSCWLTIKGGVIWAFVGPALLVILVNCVTIVIAIRTTLGLYAIARKSTVERSKSAIRCLLVLLPLMGTTWVLGVFYLDESMVWVQYAFAVCNSLQGLVIFLFRCAFDKKIWKAYYTKQQRLSTASRNVLKSRSTSVTSVMTENSEVNMTTQDIYEDNGQFNNQQQQTKT